MGIIKKDQLRAASIEASKKAEVVKPEPKPVPAPAFHVNKEQSLQTLLVQALVENQQLKELVEALRSNGKKKGLPGAMRETDLHS